jgi:hypothetical protein
MTTKAQGTVSRTIHGKTYKFLLTMYGLAEIEEALQTDSLHSFQIALASGSFKVLTSVVLVLMKEAGKEYPKEVFKDWPGDINLLMDVIKETFREAGFYKDTDEDGVEDDSLDEGK